MDFVSRTVRKDTTVMIVVPRDVAMKLGLEGGELVEVRIRKLVKPRRKGEAKTPLDVMRRVLRSDDEVRQLIESAKSIETVRGPTELKPGCGEVVWIRGSFMEVGEARIRCNDEETKVPVYRIYPPAVVVVRGRDGSMRVVVIHDT